MNEREKRREREGGNQMKRGLLVDAVKTQNASNIASSDTESSVCIHTILVLLKFIPQSEFCHGLSGFTH